MLNRNNFNDEFDKSHRRVLIFINSVIVLCILLLVLTFTGGIYIVHKIDSIGLKAFIEQIWNGKAAK